MVDILNLGDSANPDIQDTTDGTVFTNSTWTPPTTGIIVVSCFTWGTATAVVTGHGLTWVEISTVESFGQSRHTLVAAEAAGATTGITTFTTAATVTACLCSFYHVVDVDLSGGVLGAVAQAPVGNGISAGGTIPLVAASDPLNRPSAGFGVRNSGTQSPRALWTVVDDLAVGAPVVDLMSQWRTDAMDTEAEGIWSGNSNWAGVAAEWVNESGAPPTFRPAWATRAHLIGSNA